MKDQGLFLVSANPRHKLLDTWAPRHRLAEHPVWHLREVRGFNRWRESKVKVGRLWEKYKLRNTKNRECTKSIHPKGKGRQSVKGFKRGVCVCVCTSICILLIRSLWYKHFNILLSICSHLFIFFLFLWNWWRPLHHRNKQKEKPDCYMDWNHSVSSKSQRQRNKSDCQRKENIIIVESCRSLILQIVVC